MLPANKTGAAPMAKKDEGFLVLIALLINSCAPILPATQQESPTAPETEDPFISTIIPSPIPRMQLSKTDEIIFTIPNTEPFSGKEGEVRPNWLGWGAETFTVESDGSFWIADSAASPNRLLHYSPQGALLQEISLENFVVYPYDLAITQDGLWILDVSAQPPKVIKLDKDGKFQSDLHIPKEMMTLDGQFISNGVSDLSVGEAGELLLSGINGYYEIVDASGKITMQPLEVLAYYGHTYRIGVYDKATRQLPIFVDGRPLDISPGFFVEMPFLGFNPDGSFAVAGSVEDSGHPIGHEVRYYSPAGELSGTARQQPQTFHKDFNHHLAFGLDGAVFQLLSNPDHSVQILRLGFSEGPSTTAKPTMTPTPLAVLQPSDSATTEEEQARNALLTFFSGLSTQNYEEAASYYGGEKIEYAREMMPNESLAEYWEYVCSTVLQCLPVAEITHTEQVSDDEFIFDVVFVQPDGGRFEMGACCGSDPAASPPVWQFVYSVKKINGMWKMMRGPIFTP
jgi:hypothetical protein